MCRPEANHPVQVYQLNQVSAAASYFSASDVAVENINFRLHQGEYQAIWGTVGSGKSILLRLLAGMETPAQGSIYLYGEDLSRLADEERAKLRRQRLGCIFSADNLVYTLDVANNVALPAILNGENSRVALEKAGECLWQVQASSWADRYPPELNWYQQQVVVLARCLMLEHPVILADEPTRRLSSRETIAFLELLENQIGQGATCLLATTDLNIAQRADGYYEMLDGRIIDQVTNNKRRAAEGAATGQTNIGQGSAATSIVPEGAAEGAAAISNIPEGAAATPNATGSITADQADTSGPTGAPDA